MRLLSDEIKNLFDSPMISTDCEIAILDTTHAITSGMIDSVEITNNADINGKCGGIVSTNFLKVELFSDKLKQEIEISKNSKLLVKFFVITNMGDVILGAEKQKALIYEMVFYVTDILQENEDKKMIIKGIDATYKLNSAVPDNITYPITLENYIIKIIGENVLNVDFELLGDFRLFLERKTIQGNLYQNTGKSTKMSVLNDVLSVYGLVAYVVVENGIERLQFRTLHNTYYEYIVADITKKYYNFKKIKGMYDNAINTVVYRLENIEGENITIKQSETQSQDIEFVIENNDFFPKNTEDRIEHLEMMLSLMSGKKIPNFKVEHLTRPFIEIGDTILNDNVQYTVLHKSIKWNGAFDCNFGTKLAEKQEKTVRKNPPIIKLINDTKITVDKQQQKITSLVQNIDEISNKVDRVEQTITPQSIETKITSYIETNKANLFDEVGAVIRNEPPINTNVIWFDTVTKKFKVYDDTNNEWKVQDDTQEIRNFFENELSEIKGEIATKQQVLQVANDFLNKVDLLESYRQAQNGKVEEIARKSEMFEDLLGQVTTSIKQTVNGLEIGKENSNLKLLLGNNRLSFKDNDVEVAYISNQQLVITSGVFLSRLVIGRHTISTPAGVTGTIIYYSG